MSYIKYLSLVFFLYAANAVAQPLLPIKKDTVLVFGSTAELWGYWDTVANHLAIPYQYTYAEPFYDGLAFVTYFAEGTKPCKTVYINKNGKEEIVLPDSLSCETEFWNPHRNNHFFVDGISVAYNRNTDKYGYINKKLQTILPFIYHRAGTFSEGLAYTAVLADLEYEEAGDAIGYIDKKGKMKLSLQGLGFEAEDACFYIGEPFKNGIAELHSTERGEGCSEYHFMKIDKAGKVLEKRTY